MKIEKINDNQIRCILTREDLEIHQIRISELAYGTEKAKKLFRDMMQQAQIQFGFEADNIPLMIEAIPVNMDSIILIITKVEDPEELDVRFSKFAPSHGTGDSLENLQFDGADNIIDMIHRLLDAQLKNLPKKQAASPAQTKTDTAAPEEAPSVNLVRLYTFPRLDDVIAASHGLNGFFSGENSLYKNAGDNSYQLVLRQSSCTAEEFNKICNILSEYGRGRAFSPAGEAHLQEQGELITRDALQQLAQL